MSTKNKKKDAANLAAKKAAEEKVIKTPVEAPAAAEDKKPKVATPAAKPVEKPVEKPAPAEKKEEKAPEVKPEPVAPAPADKPVDNTVLEPEVVEPAENKPAVTMPTISGSIGSNLATLGDPKDRLDKNHQVDLMNMIYKEYVVNPTTDNHLGKVAKQQFDAMALISMVQYNTQIAGDLQALGVKCNVKQAAAIEQMAMELLGMKVSRLPDPDNAGQLLLQFEEIPEEVRKNAIKDVKAAEVPVPEPNPELPDKEKLEALRNIFSSKVDGGIGRNLLKGIEWGRKAFSFSVEEKKSVVLANLIVKGADSTALNCLRSMITGKLNSEHSILGAHALLKTWCYGISEEEIAELIQVLTSHALERKIQDWNERAGKGSTMTSSVENEFTLMNRDILAANAGNVIDAILAGKDDAIATYPDNVGKLNVHPNNIRKTFVAAYGDSDGILKEKLNEVAKYYATPILRLSAYADKSAYSKK